MTIQTASPRRGDFKEFKRGWRIVLLGLAGICTSITAALLYGFGTLVIPLEQAFGWSRGDLQAAITFLFAGVAISTQIVGPLYRRFGLRRVALFSIVLQILIYFSIPLMRGSIGWLYLAFFVMPIICAGTIAITWTQLVNLWFERSRGLALAIILCGTGLMAMLLPPLLARLAAEYGWQAGFIALGAMPLLITLPLSLLWLRLPSGTSGAEEPASQPAGPLPGITYRQALRSTNYWGCNFALILSVSLTVGMVTNMVPLLQSRGLSAQEAGQVFGTFGVAIIGGRLLVGYLLDRYPPMLVAAASLALPALGCAILLFSDSQNPALLIFAVLTIGASAGAEFDLAAYLMARYFGLRDYARIFGLHLGLITVISGMVPMLFGYLFDLYGSYSAVLAGCLSCAIVGPVTLLWLRMGPGDRTRQRPQHA
ncbi:MFS transporter [Pseudomonas lopnurensis]|uniref:MFS transporter n=1 Tax=Pseudomonas lopnurensis TaxID=1477517 RepID=UPI0028AC9CB9|nr:MFS transporter [Pseudomonas lopnurensis]